MKRVSFSPRFRAACSVGHRHGLFHDHGVLREVFQTEIRFACVREVGSARFCVNFRSKHCHSDLNVHRFLFGGDSLRELMLCYKNRSMSKVNY